MITAIVKYRPGRKLSADQAAQMMKGSAENMFRGVPGLYSKQFCYQAETGEGLSVYLWASQAAADGFFNDAFIEHFRANLGCVPEIEYWPTMVVVDNRSNEVFST